MCVWWILLMIVRINTNPSGGQQWHNGASSSLSWSPLSHPSPILKCLCFHQDEQVVHRDMQNSFERTKSEKFVEVRNYLPFSQHKMLTSSTKTLTFLRKVCFSHFWKVCFPTFMERLFLYFHISATTSHPLDLLYNTDTFVIMNKFSTETSASKSRRRR